MGNNHTKLCSPITFVALVAFGGCAEDEAVDSQSQTVEGTECSPDSQSPPTPGTEEFAVIAENRFDPYGILGPPIGYVVSLGTVSCPGGEPTGDPLSPCSTGSRAHTRGIQLVARTTALNGDPRGIGWTTIEANANVDAVGEGRLWGTLHLALDAGGAWNGRFTESRVAVPGGCGPWPCWQNTIQIMMCGEGGDVDGMHLRATEDMLYYRIAFLGHVEGSAFSPH